MRPRPGYKRKHGHESRRPRRSFKRRPRISQSSGSSGWTRLSDDDTEPRSGTPTPPVSPPPAPPSSPGPSEAAPSGCGLPTATYEGAIFSFYDDSLVHFGEPGPSTSTADPVLSGPPARVKIMYGRAPEILTDTENM
ncbi:unnamed protein product [Callosobruchus maculatus]|uniref:Uncharacterized protein n=1 Tax=Callosobruchus maculatus TaxID=64391 RepID=A0A653D4H3_CALMS|nr:unnamed protein product [Callosobruchus maculatus]